MENGQRPEENHVSSTSSSCSRVNLAPLATFSARSVACSNVRPTTQFLPSVAWNATVSHSGGDGVCQLTSWFCPSMRTKYAGQRWPHQSWRETHQSWMSSSQRYHSCSEDLGLISSSPARVRYNTMVRSGDKRDGASVREGPLRRGVCS